MIEPARRFAADLADAPYGRRLGLAVDEVLRDVVAVSVPAAPHLANAQGFVHGGVAASLAAWSASVLAVASDHGDAREASPVSASVSYTSAARAEGLEATARLLSRGRDLVHVGVEVASESGRAVASALLVLRAGPPPRDGGARRSAPPPPDAGATGVRVMLSPFVRALGIEIREHGASGARLAMPKSGNEGPSGFVDPGALMALADTCAALACLPSLDERRSGSATLSLSAVFGPGLRTTAVAEGRMSADSGGVRGSVVEVSAGALAAAVAYRFLAAEAS